ncbi:hypothetical protein OBBRIDRAFT_744787 [Obba rivulosa]|uniref:BHLH domain-containing protein n=1 Tax=Obba rivulosa TaxID=1052685 RepID=A0A8E2J6J3_9APHY|nr:hypothetical protein OBBRIDRAFT_744787 [Obba rivulosa]
MSHSPPVPFDDFQLFNPAVHSLFPSPPPLPASADLFSAAETTDLLGFLDNFNWEFDFDQNGHHATDLAAQFPPHTDPLRPPSPVHRSALLLRPAGLGAPPPAPHAEPQPVKPANMRTDSRSESRSESPSSHDAAAAARAAKSLLSTPQKRLNHIMSEQKRRNAIRDGYMQLTTLLAPAGAPPGTGMPTRGRPKGSGARGGRGTKGKSGILFKARDYIQWLEQGRDALLAEVLKVEAAAGIR